MANLKIETLRSLTQSLGEAAYMKVTPLRVEAWRTREPVSFDQRTEGTPLELVPGDTWGVDCFDCAWMRFSAKVTTPDDVPLFVRIDINGELCLVDADGQPLRGLTNKKSEFARALGCPAKVISALHPSHRNHEMIEFWGDAAFNDLFGKIQNGGRIECAEIVTLREDILGLYYDFEVCCDFLEYESSQEEASESIYSLLQEASKVIHHGAVLSEDEVARAREILKPVFEQSSCEGPSISAIGHGHLDLAWLWPIRESKRKGARTFATALANMELYPEYKYGCSQPQLFAWLETSYPELFSRVKSAVGEGRIEPLGTFWVEPDCNIPNGESLVRQVLHGRKYFEETFGVIPKQCWQPDVFGYNGQLPQILSKSGHDAFMTQKLSWNSVNRFPYHSFRWKGIDGTMLPAYNLPEETYNSPASPESVIKIRDRYAEREAPQNALMVFGIGDGGAGPGEAHLERLRRLESFRGLPPVVQESSAEFFKKWIAEVPNFPEWSGELYLERHQGTYTTIAGVKRANRQCEIRLRELEVLAFFSGIFSGSFDAYPANELDVIWKEVLLYQFHDILPGSSIQRVYDECLPRYAELLNQIESLAQLACRTVLREITVGESAEAVAFNVLSQPRTEWIQRDSIWHRVEVPALGWQTLNAETQADEFNAPTCDEHLLENEHICARFGVEGQLTSLVNKVNGIELIASDAPANVFQVIPDGGDAWDFAVDSKTGNVAAYLEQPIANPKLAEVKVSRDGPRATICQTYQYSQSTLELSISLDADSSLLCFEAKVDWRESKTLLRVIFPTTVDADTARYEIPFGSLRRVTHERYSVAKAQFEVPAQQWIDLSGETHGIALLNDCKYGFRIKDRTIGMSLIRSVPYPNDALVEASDTSESNPLDASKPSSDLGKHAFRYALWAHDGHLTEGALTQRAREFNSPLRLVACAAESERKGYSDTGALGFVDSDQVEVAAIKRAENGNGFVVRMVNLAPHPVDTAITAQFNFEQVVEVDLVEQNPSSNLGISEQAVQLNFQAYEIKTLHFPSVSGGVHL